jgi:hypothetical protein
MWPHIGLFGTRAPSARAVLPSVLPTRLRAACDDPVPAKILFQLYVSASATVQWSHRPVVVFKCTVQDAADCSHGCNPVHLNCTCGTNPSNVQCGTSNNRHGSIKGLGQECKLPYQLCQPGSGMLLQNACGSCCSGVLTGQNLIL